MVVDCGGEGRGFDVMWICCEFAEAFTVDCLVTSGDVYGVDESATFDITPAAVSVLCTCYLAVRYSLYSLRNVLCSPYTSTYVTYTHIPTQFNTPSLSLSLRVGRCLTVEQLVRQLRYRYDRELDRCERPALRRITEGDDTAAKTLILCVAVVDSVRLGCRDY